MAPVEQLWANARFYAFGDGDMPKKTDEREFWLVRGPRVDHFPNELRRPQLRCTRAVYNVRRCAQEQFFDVQLFKDAGGGTKHPSVIRYGAFVANNGHVAVPLIGIHERSDNDELCERNIHNDVHISELGPGYGKNASVFSKVDVCVVRIFYMEFCDPNVTL